MPDGCGSPDMDDDQACERIVITTAANRLLAFLLNANQGTISMKNAILFVAILAACSGAQAHTSSISGAANIGGSATEYTGAISGNAGSSANSSAITSTEIAGSGGSFQHEANTTTSGASIGGTITKNGVAVSTGSTGVSTSQGFGTTFGNAPVLSADGSQSILNGGEAFGDAESTSGVTSSFAKGSIGGDLSLQGFAKIGETGNF